MFQIVISVDLTNKSKAFGPLLAGGEEKLGKEGKKGPLVSMTESVSVTLLAHPDLSQVLVLLKVKPPIEIKCDITCTHLHLRQGRWYFCFSCYSSVT